MEQFLDKLRFAYEDEHADMTLDRASWSEDHSSLELEVTFIPDHWCEKEESKSTWVLQAKGIKHHRITDEAKDSVYSERIYFGDDHPLLLPHTDLLGELFVNGFDIKTLDMEKLLGKLLVAHRSVVSHWYPFEYFFNEVFMNILNRSYGLLAGGPLTLMRSYEKAVSQFGFIPDLQIAERKTETVPKVLVFGLCYIVAEEFSSFQKA